MVVADHQLIEDMEHRDAGSRPSISLHQRLQIGRRRLVGCQVAEHDRQSRIRSLDRLEVPLRVRTVRATGPHEHCQSEETVQFPPERRIVFCVDNHLAGSIDGRERGLAEREPFSNLLPALGSRCVRTDIKLAESNSLAVAQRASNRLDRGSSIAAGDVKLDDNAARLSIVGRSRHGFAAQ
jgi:hypothetical protein